MKKLKIYQSLLIPLIALPLLISSMLVNAEEVVVTGTFKGASGHVTSGGVSVVSTADGLIVVLGSDFSFDGAPDPKVGFGKSGSYDSNAQLAHLKANRGEQRYPIPARVNPGDYDEIYIWCEKYSVPLGVAGIK